MYRFHSAAMLAFLLVGAAHAQPALAPLVVDAPFEKPVAVENLHKLMPELPTELDPLLPYIRRISYTWLWQPNCDIPSMCDPRFVTKPHFRVIREFLLDISHFNTAFAQALSKSERDACSDLEFSNAALQYMTSIQIGYAANVSAHERHCGTWPWGDEWSYDVASASGRVRTSVNLTVHHPDLEGMTSLGALEVSVAPAVAEIDNKNLLGFIDAGSLLGKILTAFIQLAKFELDLKTFRSFDLGLSKLMTFLESNRFEVGATYTSLHAARQVQSLPEFLSQIEALGSINETYFLDPAATSFVTHDNKPAILVSSATLLWEPRAKLYHAAKGEDLKTLRTLGDEPSTHIVARGEGIWKIATNIYGNGQFMYALAHANSNAGIARPLQPGEVLTLPARWQFLGLSKTMIVPGDSLWKYWKAHCKGIRWSDFLARNAKAIKTKNKIYPMQVIAPCTSSAA